MIGIVNYGIGNLGSIQNMLSFIGVDSQIIDNPKQLDDVSKIILPGVGAFDTGISALADRGWIEPLNEKVLVQKIPVLGICLGMQLMTKKSEEGNKKGLGWIDGVSTKFNFDLDSKLKNPHMGWNIVAPQNQSPLHSELDTLEEIKYYFVHSYYVEVNNPGDVIFSCDYGQRFCAAFQNNNIYGVQFHPEKSHKYGFILLKNFANIPTK
jgi:glutamine amidotransferase